MFYGFIRESNRPIHAIQYFRVTHGIFLSLQVPVVTIDPIPRVI